MRYSFIIFLESVFTLSLQGQSQAASCGGWFQSPCPKASLTIGNKPASKKIKERVIAAKPQIKTNSNGKPLFDSTSNSGNGIVAHGAGNLNSPGNRN